MSGLSANIINLITDNLRDRYQSGFPILKELMQNADDAKAKRLVFGDHPGFSKSTHPLLQGTGLFFYNDGGFKESDKRAIASFAENAKAAEEGLIGKFGLGMKSVFHFCEAFFYVAKHGGKISCDILNPWNTPDDNLHPDWDTVSKSHWVCLEQVADRIADRDDQWFLLWLPLRKRSHLKNEHLDNTGSIIERFPGDEGVEGHDISFLRDESLMSKLAIMLPLLSSLSSIGYRSFASADSNFNLRLESDGRLECSASKAVVTGRVYDENRIHLSFHGSKQVASEGTIFSSLKQHPKWPRTISRDARGYQSQTPDKSQPEGSILINHNDSQTGHLSIQWALFLPLDDETHIFEAPIAQSSQHYNFIIHGQFFVEAGRRSIYAFRHMHESVQGGIHGLDEAGLRKRWNQELAQQVVLPMFLPTLNAYVQKYSLRDSEISELTEAIEHAVSGDGTQGNRNFLEIFKSSICRKHSWLRLVDQTGPSWRLLSHDETPRVFPLPPPPKSEPDRPWRVLPYLGDLDGGTLFADANSPRISRSLNTWTEDNVLNVLASVTPVVFSHPGLLEYLGDFIEFAARPYLRTSKLQKILIALVRRGFQHTPLDALRQNRQRVLRIVDFIEPVHRLSLGPQDQNAGTAIPERIFSFLWRCETDILIVPKDLDSQLHPGDAKPHSNDVLSLLHVIHARLQEQETFLQERYLDIAKQLLDILSETERGSLLRSNRELTIISVFNASSSKAEPASFKMIENARERNNLFGFAQGTTPQQRAGLSFLLSAVIPDEQILLIRGDTFRMLFFSNEALSPASDEAAILRSLGISLKSLGPEIARRTLIQRADNPGADKIGRRGLRYLLHGDENHFTNDDVTLWVARHQQSPAWEKLWRQTTGIAGQNAWNVLERGFAQNLPQARWDFLGISEIEPARVVEELLRIGTNSIDPEAFSNVECEEILSFVNDKKLWKDLPLHVFRNDEKGAISDNVYLYAGLDLPSELYSGILIVTNSNNPQVAEKQGKWIPLLDELAIITITLNAQNPGLHWRFIADTLKRIPADNLIEFIQLRETSWLPLRNGKFICPADVIHIPSLKSHIQTLAAKAEYCFSSIADLDDELQNHAVTPALQSSCFSSGTDGLSRLGLLMAAIPGYNVGEIDIPEEDLLNKTLPVLAQLQSLPAWHIVEEAKKEFDLASCIDHILRDIQHRISEDTLIQALNELSNYAEQHVKGSDDAFLLYLQIYRKDESSAIRRLPEIRLYSKSGEWKFASELCFGAADVCDNFLLDEKQAKILESVIVDSGQYDEANTDVTIPIGSSCDLQASLKIFEDYFSKWKGLVQDELIGTFLSLLGRSYFDLAMVYLGPHSVEWIFDKIEWRSPSIIDPSGRREWLRNRTPVQVLQSLAVAVKIINEDQVIVRSLTGDNLKVSLSTDFTTIIAGSPNWEGKYRCRLPIRDISPGIYPAEKLSFFIKQTVRYLLDKCYNQFDAGLDVLWQELEKSDQLEIEVARRVILNHLPFYLRQLNAHHYSMELRNALDKYDEYLQHLEAFRLSPSRFKPHMDITLTGKLDAQRSRLAEIFTDNESAQEAVLKALRQKLKDYQYDVQSIPFELFQNADDALVELFNFRTDYSGVPAVTDHLSKFLIDVGPGVVRFMHWGRLINSRGSRTTDDESRGFHRDLEKMLVLSSSDKPIDERVTGKFGLGFKSVFLCCNRPCIISGKIRIEIVGGVLPQLWTGGQEAANKLAMFAEDRRYNGTLTELQLESNVHTEDILERFQKLASLLCVFGKAIRRIELHDGSDIKRVSWNPDVLCNGVELGRCELPDTGGPSCEIGIALRLKGGTVFLALCPTGFVFLPKYIPSIWVTAPTRENESLGFAISSPFALDAGRSRLSGDTKFNVDLAQKMGRQLGDVLVEFKGVLKNDWQNSKNKLKLKEDTTIAGLWATLWRTLSAAALSHDETSAGGICRELALKAIAKLSAVEIPNGLPYPYEQMINTDSVSYELAGRWGRRDVIASLARSEIPIERCVAADIASLLKSVNRTRSITNVSFLLLFSTLSDDCCKEQDASRLESLARMTWSDLSDQERESAHSKMVQFKFKSKAGQWVDPRLLLCSNIGDNEEELRVPFTPDNNLLSDDYSDTGRAFFKRCRPRYDAPTEVMARWVLRANTETKRKAALKYLVRGELGPKVCRQLREDGLTGTWLGQIRAGHEYLHGWDNSDNSELLRLLIEKISYDIVIPRPQPPPSIDPGKALHKLYLWWGKNKQTQIKEYERRVYPRGVFPQLSYDNLKTETEPRKGWLILFILGALHTIGRAQPGHHRMFLEMCLSKGWIDRFIDTSGDSLDEWMKILKEYLENEIQDTIYFHWMREFVSIFLLGYWLDEYVESFKAIERMKHDFTLDHITCPRANPAFQGGGADAPPIKNALGMGACFVIREMSRKGIINNPLAHRYCYVPKESVRNFFIRLGCNDLKDEKDNSTRSKLIYEFLVDHLGTERAIFDGSFDLPLLEVAENPTLQQELFQEIIIDPLEDIVEEPDDNY